MVLSAPWIRLIWMKTHLGKEHMGISKGSDPLHQPWIRLIYYEAMLCTNLNVHWMTYMDENPSKKEHMGISKRSEHLHKPSLYITGKMIVNFGMRHDITKFELGLRIEHWMSKSL